MADLIVFAFDTEDGAGKARDALINMQKQQLIELEDAAERDPNLEYDGDRVKRVDNLVR